MTVFEELVWVMVFMLRAAEGDIMIFLFGMQEYQGKEELKEFDYRQILVIRYTTIGVKYSNVSLRVFRNRVNVSAVRISVPTPPVWRPTQT